MYIYYSKKDNNIKMISEKKITASNLFYIKKNLTKEENNSIGSVKYDRKVIDGKLIIVEKETIEDLVDNCKDFKDLKTLLKNKLK